MRPMDFKGLHGRDAESLHEMPSLPLGLQPHHLFANSHLCRVQVKSKQQLWVNMHKTTQLHMNNFNSDKILSPCDSRNLNLSPFCNLTLTSLAMWQPSILETYGNQTTSYVNQTSGPMRSKYPNSMGERELISSLTKVILLLYQASYLISLCYQDQVLYNAYEKDIAIVSIFFGESTVFGIKSLFYSHPKLCCSRIRKVSKDDLVGLHLRLWRHLRTLPWNQLRLRR